MGFYFSRPCNVGRARATYWYSETRTWSKTKKPPPDLRQEGVGWSVFECWFGGATFFDCSVGGVGWRNELDGWNFVATCRFERLSWLLGDWVVKFEFGRENGCDHEWFYCFEVENVTGFDFAINVEGGFFADGDLRLR